MCTKYVNIQSASFILAGNIWSSHLTRGKKVNMFNFPRKLNKTQED